MGTALIVHSYVVLQKLLGKQHNKCCLLWWGRMHSLFCTKICLILLPLYLLNQELELLHWIFRLVTWTRMLVASLGLRGHPWALISSIFRRGSVTGPSQDDDATPTTLRARLAWVPGGPQPVSYTRTASLLPLWRGNEDRNNEQHLTWYDMRIKLLLPVWSHGGALYDEGASYFYQG